MPASHLRAARRDCDGAKGREFTTLAILGETADGSFWISGNANQGEILVLMEKAKRQVVFGDDADT
jgi:hypothetical protein